MKKFFGRILVFFVFLFLIDMALGGIFFFCASHAIGGDTGRQNYIVNKTTDSILVFGSSRAIHHYNSQMMTDSLQKKCFNCGYPGMGILFNYGQIRLIEKRYKPSVIICDIFPDYDLFPDDKQRYLRWLKPYYCPELNDLFESIDNTLKYKMASKLYRCNSLFFSFILDYLHPVKSLGIRGFRPIEGEMDTMKIRICSGKKEDSITLDSLKVAFFNKYVKETTGTTLVFVVSPIWYGMNSANFAPVREICKLYNITFMDFSNDPKYVYHNEYFIDGCHLNAKGADEFTRDLIKGLKERKIIK